MILNMVALRAKEEKLRKELEQISSSLNKSEQDLRGSLWVFRIDVRNLSEEQLQFLISVKDIYGAPEIARNLGVSSQSIRMKYYSAIKSLQ